MNCGEFEELLRRTGRTEAEQEALEAHAAGCPSCRLLMDLAALDTDEPVPLSAAKKWREAVRSEAAKEDGRKKKKAFPNWARYASVAAGLVILAVGSAQVARLDLSGRETAKPQEMTAGAGAVSNAAPKAAPMYDSFYSEDAAEAPDELYAEAAEPEMAWEEEAPMPEPAAEAGSLYSAAAPQNARPREEKLVRTANVEIVSPDFDADLARIERDAAEAGGQITSSREERFAEKGRRAALTVRLPADALDGYLAGLDGLKGTVVRQEVTARDETETYYDTQGRLDSALIRRDRLNELMEQAEDVGEMTELESSLSQAQETVDALTGQLEGLDEAVRRSTVRITLTEETPRSAVLGTNDSFGNRVKNGMALSVRAIGRFSQNAALFILMLTPWLIAAGAPAALIFLNRRRKLKKSN